MWVVITQMQAAQKSKGPGGARREGEGAGEGEGDGGRGMDAGAWGTAVRLYRERGLAGFYMGLRPTLVMVVNPTIQVGGGGLVGLGLGRAAFVRGWQPCVLVAERYHLASPQGAVVDDSNAMT